MSDWFEAGGAGSPVDVTALFDSGVPALLGECVGLGALVSVGATSDGGALGVTITLDGRWRREYFRDVDSLTDWLLGAAAALREAPARRAPSGTGGQRSRKRG